MVTADRGTRREIWYLVELIGVAAVAVAQPVLDVIQAAPEGLVTRRAGTTEIVVFALLWVFGPPLVAWAVEQPFRLLGTRVRDVVHAVFLGLGLGVFVVALVKSALGAEPRSWLWVVGPLVVVGAGLGLYRSEKARSVLRYLALAAPAFVLLFLFASPVADLVGGGRVDPVDIEVAEPAPVVLIVFDELGTVSLLDGEGGIDAESYPGFARLAADSTWYRNNTGVSPVTPSAVSAIMNGRLPEETFPAPVAANFNENLFTLLGGTYEVAAEENITQLCPPTVCDIGPAPATTAVVGDLLALAGSVFESVVVPSRGPTDFEFDFDDTVDNSVTPGIMADFATEDLDPNRPDLDVGHFVLPHQPWDYLASGRTYEAPDPIRWIDGWFDQPIADTDRGRHLVQLQYTDRLLGDVLTNLEEAGRYDESLIIVTADHGAAFQGGEPLRGLSQANHHEVMWVPLFVKRPGQDEGEVSDRPTETIDILPTIAEVVGVDLPWEVDGVSVLEDGPDRPARMIEWQYNTVPPGDDGFVSFDRAEGYERVLAATTPLAGAGDDLFALQRIGPYADLVGTEVAEQEIGPPADFEVISEMPSTLRIGEDDTVLPAWIQGLWAGAPEGWAVVALDGTIAGIGKVYQQGEFASFWTMVPEALLTPGDHELSVHHVTGPAAAPVLHPAPLVPPPG